MFGWLRSKFKFIHNPKSWQRSSQILFILSFVIVGITTLHFSLAASNTETFTGNLSRSTSSRSYSVAVYYSGTLIAGLTYSNQITNASLFMYKSTGSLVTNGSGRSPIKLTTTVSPGTYKFTVSGSVSGHKGNFTLGVTPPASPPPVTTPPKAPTSLTGTASSSTIVNLSWTASTDSTGTVTGYNVYRNSVEIGTSTAASYADKGAVAATTYSYYVEAYDSSDNISAGSNVITVTTPAAPTTGGGGGTTEACQQVTVPAYYDPTNSGSPWAPTMAADPRIIIANPDSGPYTSSYWTENNYPAEVSVAEAAGTQVYGYVDTGYMADPNNDGQNGTSGSQTNNISTIEAEVNTWLGFGIKNIFFDDVTDGVSSGLGTDPHNSTNGTANTYLQDYQELTAYVHANGGKTILNPGDIPAQSYMTAGDIITIYEGNYSSYMTTTLPSWVKSGGYSPSQFYNIIYSASGTTDMTNALNRAAQDGIGYVYVTDQNLPNPYGVPASYLSTETAAAAKNCSL